MINYLHGVVQMHGSGIVVIECAGVGYEVLVGNVEEFPIGENMFIYTVFIRNDKELYLVGFSSMKQKNLYVKLTSVKGIGPKTALTAIGSTSTEGLINAINNEDEAYLIRVPGIGKKNASLIILSLRGKLTIFDNTKNTQALNKNMDIAFDGLKQLGFKENEINDAFKQINDLNLSPEEYTRKALQLINDRTGK